MNESRVDQKKAVEIKLIQANTRCAKTQNKEKSGCPDSPKGLGGHMCDSRAVTELREDANGEESFYLGAIDSERWTVTSELAGIALLFKTDAVITHRTFKALRQRQVFRVSDIPLISLGTDTKTQR